MEIIYYLNQKLGECPAKKYLSQFAKNEKDSAKIKARKEKLLTNIDRKIRYVCGNDGRPVGQISFTMKGYTFLEIKQRKDENWVIRICYFCIGEKMVLLNAFEKPANYDKSSTKRAIEN